MLFLKVIVHFNTQYEGTETYTEAFVMVTNEGTYQKIKTDLYLISKTIENFEFILGKGLVILSTTYYINGK